MYLTLEISPVAGWLPRVVGEPALPTQGGSAPAPLTAAGAARDHACRKGWDRVALSPRHLSTQNKLGEAETKFMARTGDSGSCLH